VSRELKKISTYQEGAKAMADQLPDVAIHKFRTVLADKKLSAQAKPYVTLALSEALVRSVSSAQGEENQALEALTLLNDKSLASLASTPIWKAEAMASLGQYQEAETELSSVSTKHPLSSEIKLARARILIALTRTPDALNILMEAAKSKTSKIRNAAHLLAAEIHIDQTHYELALKTLENIDDQNPTDAKLKEYLSARLALAEGKAVEATNRFQSLITAPDRLSKRIFYACILGLSDAQALNKQNDAAIATLEKLITDHPDAATLRPAFIRLTRLLPDNLADDHPSMVKLRTWSSEAALPQNILYISGDTADAILPYQPATSEHDDLVTLSLYHRALLLTRSENEKNNNLAMALLARLRSQHPAHTLPPTELYLELSSASLLETAYLQLKQNQPDQATFTLSVMEKIAFSPRLKNHANFLRGHLLAKESKLETSLTAFNNARESSSQDIANAASINTGIMALKATNMKAFQNVMESTQDAKIRTSLILERALWKCSQFNPTGRSELETFILNHPTHPRENEARMALAAACVNISPSDVTLAKAQLDITSPRLPDPVNQLTITRILIRAEKLTQNWSAAAAAAEKFILTFKDDPNIPAIMLKQGQAYYHNEDYNKARRIFQDITDKYPDSPSSPYASFYAAMSARLGGTIQAREECIGLFQAIIDSKHALSSEARIQQSRVLIDLRKYAEAETCLKPLLKSKKTPAFMYRGAGVLMGDCLHRQGSSDSNKYEQAITIYNKLLKETTLPLAWKNRLHFLRGQTYESMQRRDDAFNSYYDVVIRGNVPAEGEQHKEEWLWFYRCGFKALSMLETEKHWKAAVNLARRIAAFKGPRAEEAGDRAKSLAKKHMIWED
jgi:tetratricopeptide (TPR) repeat protein